MSTCLVLTLTVLSKLSQLIFRFRNRLIWKSIAAKMHQHQQNQWVVWETFRVHFYKASRIKLTKRKNHLLWRQLMVTMQWLKVSWVFGKLLLRDRFRKTWRFHLSTIWFSKIRRMARWNYHSVMTLKLSLSECRIKTVYQASNYLLGIPET